VKNYPAVLMIAFAVTTPAAVLVPAQQSGVIQNDNSAAFPQGTAMVVELTQSLDARKARVGDTVKAKLTQDVLSHGQLVLHRGSKVIGHVREVKTYDQKGTQSVLGLIFDKVILKGGGEKTFNAFIQALAPAAEQSGVFSSSSPYDGDQAGAPQPVSRGSSRPLVDPRDNRNNTRSEALANAADPNSYGAAFNTLHDGLLDSASRGVFGLPGVLLKPDPQSPGTVLTSTKKNIKLDSGTQMVLVVARK